MQEISTTSPGAVATYAVLWTGDVEFRSICVSITYFSCCTGGIELRISYIPTGGGSTSTATGVYGNTSTCYRTQKISTLDPGGNVRLTKVEYRLASANLCPAGTPVKFKLAFDITIGTSSGCDAAFDNVQII